MEWSDLQTPPWQIQGAPPQSDNSTSEQWPGLQTPPWMTQPSMGRPETKQDQYNYGAPEGKIVGIEPTTGIPIYDNPNTNQEIANGIGKSAPKLLGGIGAGIAENALGLPQLAAHAISPITSAPAKAMDSAVDWLTAPGSDEYNVGRQAGYWGTMLAAAPKAIATLGAKTVPMTASYADKILSNVGGWFTPNRIAAMTDPYKIQMAAKVSGSADMPGILSPLGDFGSKVAANGLMSLLGRPVENADQNGYWGPKATQTGIDAALGGVGPAIDSAVGAVGPAFTTAKGWISNLPGVKWLGAGAGIAAGSHPLESFHTLLDLASDHPYLAGGAALTGLLGALLRQPNVHPYAAPVLGTAIGQAIQSPSDMNKMLRGSFGGYF